MDRERRVDTLEILDFFSRVGDDVDLSMGIDISIDIRARLGCTHRGELLISLDSGLLQEDPLLSVVRQSRQERGSLRQELDKALKVGLNHKVAESQRDLGLVVLIAIHVGRDGQVLCFFDIALSEELFDNQVGPSLAHGPGFDCVGDISGVEKTVAQILAQFGGELRGRSKAGAGDTARSLRGCVGGN